MPYTKIFPVFDRDSKSNPEDIFNSAIRRAEQIDQSSDLNLLQSKRIPSTNMPEFFDKIADALYQPKDSDKYLPDKKLREEKLKVFLFQV